MRLFIFILLLCFLFSCREGAGFVPQQEHINQPVITLFTQNINLDTPNKTVAKIQFATSKSWTVVVSHTKAEISWISLDRTSGEAGAVVLAVDVTEPNPSSLYSREAYLKIIADTALRVIQITQPPRANTDIAVSGVTLNKSDMKLTVGSVETLVAAVQPSNATQQSVVWDSSEPSVATVDANGVVRAIKNGNVAITATTVDGDQTASCQITVVTAPESGGQINDWN